VERDGGSRVHTRHARTTYGLGQSSELELTSCSCNHAPGCGYGPEWASINALSETRQHNTSSEAPMPTPMVLPS